MFDLVLIGQILLLFLLLILSALFSSTETAITTLHPIDVKDMVLKNGKNAKVIEALKKDIHLTIAAILLGNNLVNIAASALATLLAINFLGDAFVGVMVGALTFIVLVFGEIGPKNYAAKNARDLSIRMAKPLYYLRLVLSPLLKLLIVVSDKFISKMGNKTVDHDFEFDEETISRMTEIGESEGHIEEDEKEFIQRLFKFSDKRVFEVMVPYEKLVWVNYQAKVSHAKNIAVSSGHSRIPIYKKDVGKFVGLLYVKDLLRVSDRKLVYTLLKPAMFVEHDLHIDTLLKKFRHRHIHLAMALERNSKTGEKKVVGLVTLEDIIEELIGEIVDEHDLEELKEIEEKEIDERIKETYEEAAREEEKTGTKP